jgi:hypothetical protein
MLAWRLPIRGCQRADTQQSRDEDKSVNRNRSTPSPTEELLTATSYASDAEPPSEDSTGEASSTRVRGRPLDPTARTRFLDLISAVAAPGVTLDEALESVFAGLGEVLRSPVGRIHRPGSAADRWRIEPGFEIDQARDQLDGKLEIPDTLELKALADLPDGDVVDVFRSVGLHGVVTLPVFAEGQAVGAVQLFTGWVPTGGEVTELLSRPARTNDDRLDGGAPGPVRALRPAHRSSGHVDPQ